MIHISTTPIFSVVKGRLMMEVVLLLVDLIIIPGLLFKIRSYFSINA